jgi:putative ABC transport system permease protein
MHFTLPLTNVQLKNETPQFLYGNGNGLYCQGKSNLNMADFHQPSMSLLLASVASVSLLVGGIGIMNIMLVSVTERIHEIGIRLAIGAKPHDILTQFLLEAMVLSSIGGLCGVGLGILSAWVLSTLAGWPTVVPGEAIVIAVVFSGAVGVFFGFYPARKAASFDPIQALRYE